jgi:heat shock protein HtpX
MVNKTVSYTFETDVPTDYFKNLFDFLYQEFANSERPRFTGISRKMVDDYPSLAFTVLDPTGTPNLDVEVMGGKPIKITIERIDETVPEEMIEEIKQEIIATVEIFEDKIRKSTLYFAWREGEEIVPEQIHLKEKSSINRLFLETQVLLFVVFITLGMVLFLFFISIGKGWLAPIILLAIQLVFVFYSNKLIARVGDWHITESNPIIHLLEYHLPLEEQDAFRKKFSREKLLKMKKEVYDQTISKKGKIDCEIAGGIFKEYGLECEPEHLVSKEVNVYQLVKRTADNFGFPVPEIVVSNTMLPNAAASGPSPSRGVVLITTGLLVQLDEDEILSVLGHEFGHLKGRDPLLLYGLTGGEFLFRFYVLFQLFPVIFLSLLFFVYFWLVMTLIFFIAKFFEARADLVSSIVVGQPQVLALALEKIGFRRLLYERAPQYRFQEWISLEPHPPIYFRVARLEKLKVPVKIKHPLIQSAKDVISGFRASF